MSQAVNEILKKIPKGYAEQVQSNTVVAQSGVTFQQMMDLPKDELVTKMFYLYKVIEELEQNLHHAQMSEAEAQGYARSSERALENQLKTLKQFLGYIQLWGIMDGKLRPVAKKKGKKK